jgi:23S rRNA (guanine2445-N2)-methyltransferase / 23S rRNA (guanine2069-N7)-methyltransferase
MPHAYLPAARGMEALLVEELHRLGLAGAREQGQGARVECTLEQAYRALLWSRVASRVLVEIAQVDAADAEALYRGIAALDWTALMAPGGTLAIDASGGNEALAHTGFLVRRTKDAIVDRIRDRTGSRPDVDPSRPDFRVHVHVHGERAAVSVDLSGSGMHERGYRRAGAPAPLRETLAAAVLLKAHWPAIAREGGALLDPMCGSGTFLVEGAWIAGDVAPGLLRGQLGSPAWTGHQPSVWRELLADARERRERGLTALPPIVGRDADPEMVERSRTAVERAGLAGRVEVELGAAQQAVAPAPKGLWVANPPYGRRLGAPVELPALYRALGTALCERFSGWQAAILLGEPALGRHLGLRASRRHTLFNGAIECRLLRFDLARPRADAGPPTASAASEMFANRLRKNQRRLRAWIAREGIQAYRLYDADLPEYAFAVDIYADHAHLAEYEAPADVPREVARARRRDVLRRTKEVLGLAADKVHLKTRHRQRSGDPYERLDAPVEVEIREGPARLLVDLAGHVDTGLFLDHRPLRAWLRELAPGRRFLNLFCYTAAATVHAALGGAPRSASVDLSATYLAIAERNLGLNGIDPRRHRLLRADVRTFVEREPAGAYDLVLLDPPTFSRSKRMEGTFDLQRDHPALLTAVLRLIAPGGVLLFSTHRRGFRLAVDLPPEFSIADVTARTLDPDFQRPPPPHRCWRIDRA